SITDRPPVDLQSGSGRPSPSSEPSGGRTAPKVADPNGLSGKVEVEPLGEPRSREYFAVLPDTVSKRALREGRDLDGVADVEVVDAARVSVEGEETSVLGVDPSGFRNYAPGPSAESDEIWQGIAEGRIALSDEAGRQRGLDVGGEVEIDGAEGEVTREVWTHATSGVAGIDALISRDLAAELGFPEGNGLVVSAPEADLWELKDRLEEVLGEDASLQLLAEDPEPRPAGARGRELPAETLERVIAHAETMQGVPYVWGGESLDAGGFDGSGLLQWAVAQEGVAIPRVTHDQWYAGEHVAWEDARRGDLIFWRTDPTAPDYISHVAIYLGDGMMLEAPRTGLD